MIRVTGFGKDPRNPIVAQPSPASSGSDLRHMFAPRRNQNMIEAAGSTLALIYYQTVYNLRTDHRNAIVGLLLTILQSAIFMMTFLLIYLIIGVRTSPIRADFMLYIMSGIFMFMVHVQCAGGVAGSHSISNGLLKHDAISPAVLIAAAALAVLYRQMISCIVILWIYHVLVSPVSFDYLPGSIAMYLLCWFCGGCVGLVFLGIRPWSPKGSRIVTTIYQRVNMFASGKMFVANTIPAFLLPWFIWNPLFHLIDQQRGFMFINYTPLKTSPYYPLWFSLAALMLGLLINFTTRKYESLSWGAAQ